MQGVSGVVSIVDSAAAKYLVYPVDESGHMKGPLKVTLKKGAMEFTLSPKDDTSYYLVMADLEE
jgi:hypothetical protein